MNQFFDQTGVTVKNSKGLRPCHLMEGYCVFNAGTRDRYSPGSPEVLSNNGLVRRRSGNIGSNPIRTNQEFFDSQRKNQSAETESYSDIAAGL